MRLSCPSPFGPLSVSEADGRLTALHWHAGKGQAEDQGSALVREALRQLEAWFAGRLQCFDLPLDWGQGLQARVRREMAAIPFGDTRSYGQIAQAVGAPPQAVGQACGANPLPILIPCHRVLGARGLGGYSGPGGVETKVALLRFEGAAGLLI